MDPTQDNVSNLYDMPIIITTERTTYTTNWADLEANISGLVIISINTERLQVTIVKDGGGFIYYKNEKMTAIQAIDPENRYEEEDKLKLVSFDLENIDDMRYALLSYHQLGASYVIDGSSPVPYSTIANQCTNKENINVLPMNGLVLKTYQNDMYNNWLNSEWIEGEGSITDLTKVEVVDGSFSMDTFNFKEKLYNNEPRSSSRGTSEDYQDVVYEESHRRHIETPVWVGGMSKEIVFDEVIQTAPADGDPLGTLGGRGRTLEQSMKGGKLDIKVDEWSYIIGIVSLTPRQFYTQGNDWDMTEIDSIADIHVPGMDGIGFQDLIGEQLAWWDTHIHANSGTIYKRSKIGKLPAWINYMTDVDQAYGDFAEPKGKGYMILNRNYEFDKATGGIKDATTYVDPSKYNYAFAYNELEAQNFWCEIVFHINARRLMSARIIPNV